MWLILSPKAGMIPECSHRLLGREARARWHHQQEVVVDVVSVTMVLGMLGLTMVNSSDYNLKLYFHMLGITPRANTCHLEGKAFTVVSSAHVTWSLPAPPNNPDAKPPFFTTLHWL